MSDYDKEDSSSRHSLIGSTILDRETTKYVPSSPEEEEEVPDEIAQKETQVVLWLRVGVIAALLSAGAIVSFLVYMLTSTNQDRTFRTAFKGETEKVFAEFTAIVSQKLGALASLGGSFTAYSRATGNEFPFVAMNDFHARAATARILSGALTVESSFRVTLDEKEQWNNFSTANSGWFRDGFIYQEKIGFQVQHLLNYSVFDSETINHDADIASEIFSYSNVTLSRTPKTGDGPFYPMWQTSPVRASNFYNYDRYKDPDLDRGIDELMETGSCLMIGLPPHDPGIHTDPSADFSTSYYSSILSIAAGRDVWYGGQPMSQIYVPVFDSFSSNRNTVGLIVAILDWPSYLQGVVSESSNGVVVVLENECYGTFSYLVQKRSAVYLGEGDLSNPDYAQYVERVVIGGGINVLDGSPEGIPLNGNNCTYNLAVYPSDDLYNEFHTALPLIITVCILGIFIFTMIMFYLFNRIVERRQYLVLTSAKQTGAIVSSMFPKKVRDQLLEVEAKKVLNRRSTRSFLAPHHLLKSYLNEGEDHEIVDDKPIADLFPFCTVLFADIAGFTSWSSTREPAQVFILLQSLYQAFDLIARRTGVFKIETIGDTYVAVCGLPKPSKRHAEIMSGFAWDCMKRFHRLTKHMELTLGPGTSALGLRIGIHSGPVTAGVLRGDRARFQLFGDTVNTAARMESTCQTNRIQLTNATADLLVEAGKGSWISAREDVVIARGLGALSTYWLTITNDGASIRNHASISTVEHQKQSKATREARHHERLVSWMTKILGLHIRQALAHRQGKLGKDINFNRPKRGDLLSETVEVIHLPKFDSSCSATDDQDYDKFALDSNIVSLLHDFVTKIASMYNKNPFHNFEHVCHVCMCIDKFVKRIVAPDLDLEQIKKGSDKEIASRLHDYTYGINTDPLLPLALIFSGMIHDVGHRGCSNIQLCKEDPAMAKLYNNKSVAEQNSLDMSWPLLMGPEYQQLRNVMFGSSSELEHFRQLVVNVVLATDIFDKELNGARRARWNKAFDVQSPENADADLRATIVIEHIIQASDVSHTMQHWHVYRKYNKRLFKEFHRAFKDGRMGADPAKFWYKGELDFFDNYVIPLAEKLRACNVFGVSSDECLIYALQNRVEWETRGQELVNEMIEEVNSGVDEEEDIDLRKMLLDETESTVTEKEEITTTANSKDAFSNVKKDNDDVLGI